MEDLQKGNNKLSMERKLWSRMQGEDESHLAYYYDIMNMCRILDPNMNENTKLDHLYQGLKRSIFTSVCIQKPETCERFLKLIKLHAEAGDMTRKNNSRVGMVLADEDPTEEGTPSDQLTSDLLAFIGSRHKYKIPQTQPKPTWDSLLNEIKELKEALAEATGNVVSTVNDREGNGIPSAEKMSRTSDGKPICYGCNQPGHIKKFCTAKVETTGSAGDESSPKQGAGAVSSSLVATAYGPP